VIDKPHGSGCEDGNVSWRPRRTNFRAYPRICLAFAYNASRVPQPTTCRRRLKVSSPSLSQILSIPSPVNHVRAFSRTMFTRWSLICQRLAFVRAFCGTERFARVFIYFPDDDSGVMMRVKCVYSCFPIRNSETRVASPIHNSTYISDGCLFQRPTWLEAR
jgi:hypothetical protein